MIECLTPWSLILNLFQSHSCSEIYNSALPTDPVTFGVYFPYFLKTFVLELPIYFILLKNNLNIKNIFKSNTILNLATHPMVFFGWPLLLSQLDATYLTYLIVAEIFAPAVEAALLIYAFKIPMNRAVIAALIANLFSWSIGVFWI